MENWESLTSGILAKIFFAVEEEKDVIILSFIHEKILFERQTYVDPFVKLVIDGGIIDICLRLMKPRLELLMESTRFHTLSSLLSVILNCSDINAEMGRAVISKQLHKAIINCIEKPFFKVENMHKSPKIKEIIETMFTVLYNALRLNSESKQSFRDAGVIELCLEYVQASVPVIKTLALFLLAYAADISANPKLIEGTSSNIKYILQSLLGPAVNSTNKRHFSGWSLQEILEALSLLSENNENAIEMAAQGMLHLCEKILENNSEEKEIKPCLSIVWSMSFVNNELRGKIKHRQELLSLIIQRKESQNDLIKKSACGILWNVDNLGKLKQSNDPIQSSQPKQSLEEASMKLHIMISYSWNQKYVSVPRCIYDKLIAAGKNVWIDVKHMQSDMSSAMAAAVENSSHVICFISEEYARSKNCKQEAEYAFELEKKMIFVKVQRNFTPTGWLAFKKAGQLYHEMYSEEDAEMRFGKLISDLDGKVSEESSQVEKPNVLETNRSQKYSSSEAMVAQWSKEDVLDWFKTIGCSNDEKASEFLKQMDGKMLKEFCTWHVEAREFFLKLVKEEFAFDLIGLVKFSSAIVSLMKE